MAGKIPSIADGYMKIAIMFNGQFRWFDSFKRSFQQNFKPALEGHEVQYFAHFWNEGLEKLPDFIEICGPMILHLENLKSADEIKKFLGFTKIINGTLPNQTYCMYKVFDLLQKFQNSNKQTFDLYIRMRSDLFFPDKIIFDQFDSYSVYSKKCHPGTTLKTFHCDFAYFTRNYEAVQKMASFGLCLDKTIEYHEQLKYCEFLSQNTYCPEELLARHVSQQNLSAKFHDFNLDLARHHI
jgi:hypothetical protein